MEKVGRLEGNVSAMEGELAVVGNVNTLLSHQLDMKKSRLILSKIMHDSYGSLKVRE